MGMLIDKYKSFRFFSPIHHTYMESSLKMFKKNIFSGVGFKSYKKVCSKSEYQVTYRRFLEISNLVNKIDDTNEKKLSENKNCSTHPHNIVLQIIAETGLISLVIFIIFYIFLIIKFLNNLLFNYREKEIIVISLWLLLYLFPILPSSNFFGSLFNLKFYIYLSFFIYFSYFKVIKKIV